MRAATVYRALLRCYPAPFRQEYGGEMLLVFAEQLREARRRRSRLETIVLWARAATDAATVAPREHAHVIAQDLRYALRTMTASPGFTAVAVLSLALGIGANTAIFSLWNGLLRAPLPVVHEPENLVMLSNPADAGMWTGRWNGRTDGPRSWLTFAEFEQLRDHAGVFSALMASQSSLSTWPVRVGGGAWEQARGRLVSAEYFQVLGVGPFLGRVFAPAEERADAASAVISYSYWRRRFGGDPGVLGKTLALRKSLLTIVGVTPPGFIGETIGQQPDLWLSVRAAPDVFSGDRLHDTPPVKVMWLHVFGRLKPGVTPVEAEARANALFQSGLESFYGATPSEERRRELLDQRLGLWPGAGGASLTRHEFAHSLSALLAAVGVMLLIACANLASLLIARGAARRGEIALRLSLGASRGRLVRQLVTESLALAAIGGVAAIAVAYALHGALVRRIAESDVRFHMGFSLDPGVLTFALAATVGAGLLFGVFPAWQVTRDDAGEGLKDQARGGAGSLSQTRAGRLLVSLQLALSLPLLVGAGLLARSVYNLQRADLGFALERLLAVRVDLSEEAGTLTRRDRLTGELLEALAQVPGVRAASFSELGVFTGGNSSETVEVDGRAPGADRDRESGVDVVGPGYFSTLGVPILRGREILEGDRAGGPRVCVVNEAFARKFLDGRDPVGVRFASIGEDQRTAYQIVGLARDAHTRNLGDVEARYFVAAAQAPSSPGSPTFLIRTATPPGPALAAVRTAIQRVDPAVPIMSAETVQERMAPLTAQDRTTAQLAVAFGCVALALAAIGLYGVLSHGIARRTGEIAVRIALGALPGRVVAMILRETAAVVAAGLALGGGLAWGASRLIASRLYGVAPEDPLTMASAIAVLLLVALGAAYGPARRASRLDPMAALRRSA